jgi:hypothetical protein
MDAGSRGGESVGVCAVKIGILGACPIVEDVDELTG